MVGSGAFHRSIAIRQIIVQAQETLNGLALQAFIEQLGTYTSRGHGGQHRPKARIGFMFAQHRKAKISRNSPHQGAKEIARRLAHPAQCMFVGH